jgi:plasmid stabilization system protein ParE
MAKIRWTDEAVNWLQDIHDYIAKDNPKIANKVVNDIFDKVQIFQSFFVLL